MNLPIFTESQMCRSKHFCQTCRSRSEFRDSLTDQYSFPDGNLDFQCPHGEAWIVEPFKDDSFEQHQVENERRKPKPNQFGEKRRGCGCKR